MQTRSTLLLQARLAGIMAAASMAAAAQSPATNAVDPDASIPEPESRQVRRARERREAKKWARRP